MKLSTIIRCMAQRHIDVDSTEYSTTLFTDGTTGPGLGVVAFCDRFSTWPERATTYRIGDLTVAWWGRDTLVHPTEAS